MKIKKNFTYTFHNNDKVYLNGQQITFNKGSYKVAFKWDKGLNINNEVNDGIEKNSIDDTPATMDKFSLLLYANSTEHILTNKRRTAIAKICLSLNFINSFI